MPNYRVTIEPISEKAIETHRGGVEVFELDGLVLLGNESASEMFGNPNATKETVVILGSGCSNSLFVFLTESMPDEIKKKVAEQIMLKDIGLIKNNIVAAVKREDMN